MANFYIDNFSYQENLLPKYHQKLGHDVEIVASLVSFDKNGNSCLLDKASRYLNEYNIPVTRLNFKKGVIGSSKRFRKYIGTYEAIEKSKPDIIFIHGCQFADVNQVVKYLKKNLNVKVYVDNHADFSNSATNWISKNILHKKIWRYFAKKIEPFVTKFYGVMPARVEFLKEIYKIPEEKVELLVMGADDDKINEIRLSDTFNKIRQEYGIEKSDFLLVTGGKVDNAKRQTLLLMEAVKKITSNKIKLIIFGSVTPELKSEFDRLVDGKKIIYVGWIESNDSYKYFQAADLVVFPGRHSVFWEQAVGQGKPLMVKWWEGTTHIDIGGNVFFLETDSKKEIQKEIDKIFRNKNTYNDMLHKANSEKKEMFLYSNIAKKSLE